MLSAFYGCIKRNDKLLRSTPCEKIKGFSLLCGGQEI